MIRPEERILLVAASDEETERSCQALASTNRKVVCVADATQALARFREDGAFTIVVFAMPPVTNGVAFVTALYEADRKDLVILGQGRLEQRGQFRECSVTLFLPVPWTSKDLFALVRARRLTMGIMNLHDAFMNASLLKCVMDRSPLVRGREEFTDSDRGRAERLWIALLAVLVESWDSSIMKPVRHYIASIVDTSTLIKLCREARKKAKKDNMVQVRHYMFHRDERQYWDQGRLAVLGQLAFYTKLHNEFSAVLLAAMRQGAPGSGEAGEAEVWP